MLLAPYVLPFKEWISTKSTSQNSTKLTNDSRRQRRHPERSRSQAERRISLRDVRPALIWDSVVWSFCP